MLVIKNIIFKVGRQEILKRVSLQAKEGEILGILGPSGAGKTTIFRIISGLIEPNSGSIKLNDINLNNLSVSERPISYLQQSFPLYDNLDVFKNVFVAFESFKKVEKNDLTKIVQNMLLKVGIKKNLWERRTKNLSGGEAQRVALAKALLKPCKILLLDEPFSNIDKNAKRKFNQLIRKICKERNLTTIYISHSEDDLILVADRIAYIESGLIIQTGTHEDILKEPKYGKVASIGSILGLQLLSKSDLIELNISEKFLSYLPYRCEKIGWIPEATEIYKEKEDIIKKNENECFVFEGKIDRISNIGLKIYLGINLNDLNEWQYIWHAGDIEKLKDFKLEENVYFKVNLGDILFLDEKDAVLKKNGLLQTIV